MINGPYMGRWKIKGLISYLLLHVNVFEHFPHWKWMQYNVLVCKLFTKFPRDKKKTIEFIPQVRSLCTPVTWVWICMRLLCMCIYFKSEPTSVFGQSNWFLLCFTAPESPWNNCSYSCHGSIHSLVPIKGALGQRMNSIHDCNKLQRANTKWLYVGINIAAMIDEYSGLQRSSRKTSH